MKAVGVLVLLVAAGVPVWRGSTGTASAAQLSPSTAPRTSSSEGLALVVDRRNPVTNVSLGQLREIMFGDRQWWSCSHRITLTAMRRGTAERQAIQRTIYKMDDRDFDTYFLFQVFRGLLPTSPTILQTPAEVKRFVASTPGAVGYLRASDVDDSVKVVRINGLLPGDDGYPLRLRVRPPK